MPYVPARTPDTQQRMIVLYALSRLSPCYDLQLLQFFGEYGLMNYFDMMFALVDLCREGQAVRTPRVNQNLYELTDSGREALRLLIGHVPLSVREQIDAHAQQWKERFSRELEYASEMENTERGEVKLKMYVMEQNMRMLEIGMSLPDEHTARSLQEKWPGIAGEVYGFIIRKLAEDPQ